jgi:hypothetical protein
MSITQRDYILRLIEQLGQVVARVMDHVTKHEYEPAMAAVDEAERALLGDQLRGLQKLDATSATLFLHNPERTRGWALLLAQRAYLLGLMERPGEARTQALRAEALYAAAERRGAQLGKLDDEARRRLESLTRVG